MKAPVMSKIISGKQGVLWRSATAETNVKRERSKAKRRSMTRNSVNLLSVANVSFTFKSSPTPLKTAVVSPTLKIRNL